MKRQPKVRTMPIGARIRVRCNGMSWNGVQVPLDTVGTVYLATRLNGGTMRAVHFDGFDRLQPNGFYFGIGGDASKTFVPEWAEVIEDKRKVK